MTRTSASFRSRLYQALTPSSSNWPNVSRTLTRDLPCLFSAGPFPGYHALLEWRREDMGGHWYYSQEIDAEGWLCPALFEYFETAPPRIYAQFKTKVAQQAAEGDERQVARQTDVETPQQW